MFGDTFLYLTLFFLSARDNETILDRLTIGQSRPYRLVLCARERSFKLCNLVKTDFIKLVSKKSIV